MIKHVRFVRKTDQKVFTPAELVRLDETESDAPMCCGIDFICASLCNYGLSVETADEKWLHAIRDFYDDGDDNTADQQHIQDVFESYLELKDKFEVQVFEPKRLLIEMVIDGLTLESFDDQMNMIRENIRDELDGRPSLAFYNGRESLDDHDDFQQPHIASKWEL